MRLGRLPISVESGRPAAFATASQLAMSIPAIAMRTIPCTPMSAKRRASMLQRSMGAIRSPWSTRSASARIAAIDIIAAGK